MTNDDGKNTSYYIVDADDMMSLEQEVRKMIDDGWIPLGAPTFYQDEQYVYQAMWRAPAEIIYSKRLDELFRRQ